MKSNAHNIPERYKILAEIGSGGMGSVYRVHDSLLDRTFALKVLKFTGSTAGSEILRFQKEAKAAASLQHENIMLVIDFGYHEKNTPYMVLEYVEGTTLQQRIQKTGSLSLDEATDIFEQTARALSFAHSRNVIHRDLKSSNIFLTTASNGSTLVKLFDFGIAQILEDPSAMRLTASNAIIGTPRYMSPEQVRGEKADARSDIYSFGCVMFETLTGKLPFQANSTFDLLDMHLTTEAPKLGSIKTEFEDSQIERIIDKCLEKDPANRFQSASEISRQLTGRIDSEGTHDSSVDGKSQPGPVWKKRVLLGIAILCLAVVGIVVQFQLQNQSTEKVSKPQNKPATQVKGEPRINSSSGLRKLPMAEEQNHDQSEDLKEPTAAKPNERKVDWNRAKGGMLALREIEGFETDDILKIPRSIVVLDLSDMILSDRLFDNIAGLDSIQRINLSTSRMLTDQTLTKEKMAALSRMKNLTHFCVQDTMFADFSDIQSLKGLIRLEASNLSAHQVELLSPLPKLQSLDLRGSRLDEPMLKALSRLSGLKTLVLHLCDPIAVEKLSDLTNLSKLEDLKISDSRSIANNIAPLTKLNIKTLELRNDGLSDKDAEQIARMSGIIMLKVSDNQFTDSALTYFAKMPNLQTLNIENCPNLSADAIRKFKKSAKAVINAAVDKKDELLGVWPSQKYSNDNYDPSPSTLFNLPLPQLPDEVDPARNVPIH